VLDLDDVRMPKKPEKLDFPKDPSGIRNMLEYVIDLLNSDLLASVRIDCRANHSVTTLSDDLLDTISVAFSILCEEISICVLQFGRKRKEKKRKTREE
jgi:hypothetical protein